MTCRLGYVGATPGANSNDYTLFSTVAAGFPALAALGLHFYALSLAHDQAGTLKVYKSHDGGATWVQVAQQAMVPSATAESYFECRVSCYADWKVAWTNGGSSQTTWAVDQQLSRRGGGGSAPSIATPVAGSTVFALSDVSVDVMAADGAAVDLYLGDPDAGGVLIGSRTGPGPIAWIPAWGHAGSTALYVVAGGRKGAAVPITVATYSATSAASASAGPFSDANYLSYTGAGSDLTPGSSIALLVDIPSTAVNQVVWSHQAAARGWALNFANTTLNVLMKGASPAFVVAGFVYAQLNCVVLSRLLDGSLRVSLNGGPDTLVHAAPGYVANDGTSVNWIGRHATGGFGSSQAKVLAVAHIASELDASTRVAIADCVNSADRYAFPAALKTHPALTYEWEADRDFAAAASTSTAGLGSSPPTWTESGTVAKNTIEAERIYVPQEHWWRRTIDTAKAARNAFAEVMFSTDAQRIAVNAQIETAIAAAWRSLGSHDGTTKRELKCLETGDMDRTLDVALGAGAKPACRLWDGLRTRPAATVLGHPINSVRVPSSAAFEVLPAAASSDLVIVYGDSISVGAEATYAATGGWVPLMGRAGWYAGDVICEGYGYRGLWSDCSTEAARIALVARWTAAFSGRSTQRLLIAIGTNDYGLSLCTHMQFEVALADLCDRLHVALPALEILIMTPVNRGTETANALGSTMAQYRAAEAAVQSARSGYISITDGTTICSLPGDYNPDLLHPNDSGHSKISARIDSIW